MIQPPYATGTAKVTAGSAIVEGTTTAWAVGLVAGGLFTRLGLAVPIVSVESNTSLTLAYAWPGGTGTGAYAIDLGRADAASAIVANRRLADVLSGLATMSVVGSDLVARETTASMRDLLEVLGLAGGVLTGTLTLAPGTAARAPLRLPPGVAPNAPANGDLWATAAALIARINGATRTLYDNVTLPLPTQAQAEAGTVETPLAWSPLRDRQAIDARLATALSGPITTPAPVVRSVIAGAATIANQSGLFFGAFSGLLAVTDRNSGSTAIFLCGSGTTVLVGQTGSSWRAVITSGFASVSYDPNSNSYAIYNARGGAIVVSAFSVQLSNLTQ